MRFILVSIVLLSYTCAVHSQVTIDYTQKLRGVIGEQKIAENAIQGSVVIVKQSYQVKNRDNGKTYGQNGRSDFGHNYSLGIKTEAGLVLTDGALKPWLYDDAYKRVEDKYEPIISLTEIREIEVTERSKFTQCPLRIGRQQPEGMWIADIDYIPSNAMEIDAQDGEKDGSLIWFVTKNNLDNTPNASISVQVVNKKIDVKGGDIDVDVPSEGNLVLGGIYVCPSFLGGGHVAYKLVGVMVNVDGVWLLRTPFIGMTFQTNQQKKDQGLLENKSVEEVELTPIGENKKTKGGKRNNQLK